MKRNRTVLQSSPHEGMHTQTDLIVFHSGMVLFGYVHDPNVWVDVFGLLKEFEIAPYGSSLHLKDGYSAYELLQNAWLKHNSGVTRGTGQLSRKNPAIALVEKPLHKRIYSLQSKYGLLKGYSDFVVE
ncbi:hypothetical protein [Paenibacillus durus]|uniref:hypothetical protein n=1 Tax=Paenibacillus durus TaxID=44251 RepID=UPI0012E08229|nr:hypothetical protein [Paenibacillus durus]